MDKANKDRGEYELTGSDIIFTLDATISFKMGDYYDLDSIAEHMGDMLKEQIVDYEGVVTEGKILVTRYES